MSLFGGLALNTGSYYGSGYTAVGGSYLGRTRVASSTNASRIARDIASLYGSNVSDIQTYLAQGDSKRALEMYDKLLSQASISASEYGYSLTDVAKRSIIEKAYSNVTGSDISSDFSDASDGAFVKGLSQGFNLLSDDTLTKAEVQAKISGTTVSTSDRVAEATGAGVAGALTGATVGAGLAAISGVVQGIAPGALAVNGLCGALSAIGSGAAGLFGVTISGAMLPVVIGGALVLGAVAIGKTIYENCKSGKEQEAAQA